MKSRGGFTLIELLIVAGIAVILAGVVIGMINPVGQIKLARNRQRETHLTVIGNAVAQRMADYQGRWICPTYPTLPSVSTTISSGGADLYACLMGAYTHELPVDPASSTFIDGSNYNIGYTVYQEATSTGGRVVLCAPSTEIPPASDIICN